MLAAAGKRGWPISPALPALVILIDEYAELAEKAPDAMSYTDSIARLGRAVAVTLIAATQRPTQKAMGQGAVRSQMDLRICFRVREPRDVDLILGQGMLKAGWDAHNLNAPGKFLISAPGHDRPGRARAYLLTDEVVTYTTAHYAGVRPVLDVESRRAIDSARWTRAQSPHSAPAPDKPAEPEEARETTDSALWQALCAAPSEGWATRSLHSLIDKMLSMRLRGASLCRRAGTGYACRCAGPRSRGRRRSRSWACGPCEGCGPRPGWAR